ncbi:cell division protein FtsA [Cerasibacillus sp. JNUCC 74]
MKDVIFALDIGTRSVTGIILKQLDNYYEVIDYCMLEHQDRSMRDGQIHNVVAVAKTIAQVKSQLEASYGPLEKVCVAAAGRALITMEASASIKLKDTPISNEEAMKHLELSAVQAALEKISGIHNKANYYCVGYSILHYYIDQQKIGSLIDQQGDVASVDIIATFLPRVVIESLLAALTRAKLEMEALTLEPIAAIHVLIPESMRRLNVALVDIGAGTSDIAITNYGTVVAYGMVPIAGDEITEAISDTYLLDFPMAEAAKRTIVDAREASVTDILGFETTISYETLIRDIAPAVDNLASQIAEEILTLNANPPKAVMLVGGGSLTPTITTAIARKLQLPENRVAIRGIEAIKQLNPSEKLLSRPDFVTPIGIAIAAKQKPVHYVSVKVNEQTVRLFEMRTLTVGDCLIQARINIQKWYGKPGLASIVTINGKQITIPGEFGEPPKITLNGRTASVNDHIKNGDQLEVTKGEDGQAANVSIHELLGEISPLKIHLNDNIHKVHPIYMVNQQPMSDDYIVKDKDVIQWYQPSRLEEIVKLLSTEKLSELKPFTIYMNGKSVQLKSGETQVYVNGQTAELSQQLFTGDHIQIKHANQPKIIDYFKQENKEYFQTITVFFNGKQVELRNPLYIIKRDKTILDENTPLYSNDRIELHPVQKKEFIFQDVFKYVDLELSKISGKFEVLKNKQPANFHDPIQTGDELEIIW